MSRELFNSEGVSSFRPLLAHHLTFYLLWFCILYLSLVNGSEMSWLICQNWDRMLFGYESLISL